MLQFVSNSGSAPRHPATQLDEVTSGLPAGQVQIFEAKESLFDDGDAASHVYQVISGNVCVYRMLSDGRRQVIEFAYPGDIIGLGAIGEHAATAVATSRTRARCIPVSALHQFARKDSELGIKLYEAVSRELLAARDQLLTVGQRSAPERLASFLVALSRRNERNGQDASEFVLPMTRTDIADFLGLTIETVSRTFSKFKAKGLIDIEQSIIITIRDADALEELADGDCETKF